MKVVILAAGRGLRLGEKEHPKPLVELMDGKSILQHQISNLEHHVSKDDIFIVVGFHKELFIEEFPDLTFVYSPGYAQQNTSKSLLKAIRKIQDDVLWLNGDVVFHSSVLPKLLNMQKNCMLVNQNTDVGDEEVKYRADALGKIQSVSKTVSESQGEALGVNFFKKESLPLLQKQLQACSDQDYFEKAIEKCILDGLDVWSCPIADTLCTEVDFPDDLKYANTLIKSWYKVPHAS